MTHISISHKQKCTDLCEVSFYKLGSIFIEVKQGIVTPTHMLNIMTK